MKVYYKTLFFLSLFIIITYISTAYAQPEIMMNAVKKELNRSMTELKKEPVPPYFISYFATETIGNQITASFGKIKSNDNHHFRLLDIDLHVGSYKLDNKHIVRGSANFGNAGMPSINIPIDGDESVVRNLVWSATDRAYKSAIESYEKALSNQAVKIAEEDTSDDFSREKPSKFSEDFINVYYPTAASNMTGKAFVIDTAKWVSILRRLSDKFSKYPWIFESSVSFSAGIKNKFFVNSEGSELKFPETYARVFISVQTKAEDGMTLPLHQSYFAFECEQLPAEATIAKDIDAMIDLLAQLRKAPMATTFSGPAILSGEASGVFFHEIFGHRVEGHREKDPTSSQTFKNSIGTKILPDFMNVVFDPTCKKLRGTELSGYYQFDDEGVKGQKVVSVKNGIFESFLMSRCPIEGFPNSNGHGRKQAGYTAVTRQSNLIVESNKAVTKAELEKKLIAEAKKQNKEYGLYFEKVSGGFTFTTRYIPNSFNVTPLVVYKVYADGRPRELVRGVDLIGTPLSTFANIIASADDMETFNGICGAESGSVPVSASSPSLLVSTIEVQKKVKSQAKLPILPAP